MIQVKKQVALLHLSDGSKVSLSTEKGDLKYYAEELDTTAGYKEFEDVDGKPMIVFRQHVVKITLYEQTPGRNPGVTAANPGPGDVWGSEVQ